MFTSSVPILNFKKRKEKKKHKTNENQERMPNILRSQKLTIKSMASPFGMLSNISPATCFTPAR